MYTLRGEPLCTFNVLSLSQTSGYVLVSPGETFWSRDYECAFRTIIAERKAQRGCKSMPAMTGESDCCALEPLCPRPKRELSSQPRQTPCKPCPSKKDSCQLSFTPCAQQSSCIPTSDADGESDFPRTTSAACGQNPCAQSRRNNSQIRRGSVERSSMMNKCPPPPPPHRPCNKTACQLEGSDDCFDCPEVPGINYKCKSRKPPTPMVLRPATGFFAKCCPCCASKYKCVKCVDRPPTSGCSPNAKVTQTDNKDFKISKKQMSQAMKEEKKRQQQYQKRRQTKPCPQRKDICPPLGEEDCADPKVLQRREKARDRYCIKRRKMEQKLKKTLEKQYKTEC